MSKLTILSGGAAKGLVDELTPQFAAETGFSVGGEFSAVGAMAAKFRAGTRADLVILTSSLIAELTREGKLLNGSARDLGIVYTGVAFRAGDTPMPLGDGNALRIALLASDAIYVLDMEQSTAGIHILKVLNHLGIADDLTPRLRTFTDGATAMRELAASHFTRPIGCTQVTEILTTPGITLAGPLPNECELATVYTGALYASAAYPEEAKRFLALLTGDAGRGQRARAGFVDT
jgi:molybdate transport system substrate-binding protein